VELVAADDDWAVCVMHDVITHTTHDGATHGAEPPRTHHYHCAFLLSSNVGNHLARLTTEYCFYLASQLPTHKAIH